VFDFLSNQILSIVASRRSGSADGLVAETRRLMELDAPKTPVARPASTEDQVFLSGAAHTPPAPIPLKPSEPAETGNRVGDVLRRLRRSRRKATPERSHPEEEPSEDTPDNQPKGHRFDRWA
jgi:hypothetical protein